MPRCDVEYFDIFLCFYFVFGCLRIAEESTENTKLRRILHTCKTDVRKEKNERKVSVFLLQRWCRTKTTGGALMHAASAFAAVYAAQSRCLSCVVLGLFA